MAESSNNAIGSDYKLSNFTSIIDLSPSEVLAIVKNDKWLETNKTTNPQRYIKFTLDGTKITEIQKKISMEEGFTKIDTNFDIQSLTPDLSLTLAQLSAILFSVNGNNGPYKTIKSFIKMGGVLDTDEKKKFIAHLAWIINSGGLRNDYVEGDPLVKLERILKPELVAPEITTGNEIFTSPMYRTYLLALQIIEFLNVSASQIIGGITMDLDRTNTYITNIMTSRQIDNTQAGGSKRKIYKKSKRTKKSKSRQ